MDLSIELAPKNKLGLRLVNPVMTASGTFGYGTEYAAFYDVQRLGAIICKGTTLEPREGNHQPRLFETASGMLNSIGLQNIGVDALIKEKAPEWASWQVPVIVNIAGKTEDEYAGLAAKLDAVPGVKALEINISCPNVNQGGIEFGTNPRAAAAVTAAVKRATSLPVIVKLTPNSDVAVVARAVVAAGADALTLINTLRGMAIDVYRRGPLLGNKTGGLSGPAIKPVALAIVYEIAGIVDIPVIGCGGIATGTDAVEFLMAGARAVQVGTASFSNPGAALDVLAGIETFMQMEGVQNLDDIIGAARK